MVVAIDSRREQGLGSETNQRGKVSACRVSANHQMVGIVPFHELPGRLDAYIELFRGSDRYRARSGDLADPQQPSKKAIAQQGERVPKARGKNNERQDPGKRESKRGQRCKQDHNAARLQLGLGIIDQCHALTTAQVGSNRTAHRRTANVEFITTGSSCPAASMPKENESAAGSGLVQWLVERVARVEFDTIGPRSFRGEGVAHPRDRDVVGRKHTRDAGQQACEAERRRR